MPVGVRASQTARATEHGDERPSQRRSERAHDERAERDDGGEERKGAEPGDLETTLERANGAERGPPEQPRRDRTEADSDDAADHTCHCWRSRVLPHGIDGSDAARTDRRHGGRTTRDDEPEDDAEQDPPTAHHHRSLRRLEAHGRRDAQHGPTDPGTDQGAQRRADEPEDERLTEHEPAHLPHRRTESPEQTELTDALCDQHRERVDDDEPAHHDPEAGEQRHELWQEPDARRPRGVVRPDHLRPRAERTAKGVDRGLDIPLRIKSHEQRVEARCAREAAGSHHEDGTG